MTVLFALCKPDIIRIFNYPCEMNEKCNFKYYSVAKVKPAGYVYAPDLLHIITDSRKPPFPHFLIEHMSDYLFDYLRQFPQKQKPREPA